MKITILRTDGKIETKEVKKYEQATKELGYKPELRHKIGGLECAETDDGQHLFFLRRKGEFNKLASILAGHVIHGNAILTK